MKFEDSIVLVTGSSRGIGKEIARGFAREGAQVLIVGRDPQTAQNAQAEFTKKGLKADHFACDVSNYQSVEEMVNKILDKYKRVDILVNNAGITNDNLLLRMNEDAWDSVIRVNLKSLYSCTKVVSKAMLRAKKGKIINIASIIGIIGNAGQANYAATKAGIIGFTKSIAKEFGSRGITANAIAPGYIETEMTAQMRGQMQETILNAIPMKRYGAPADIAGVCLFLASKEADYITGQTIVVDGGMAI